jgi:hypothetical protein
MKTKNIGFLAIAAVMANLLAATIGYSQTERFSATLAENEVLNHSAGTAAFDMTIGTLSPSR